MIPPLIRHGCFDGEPSPSASPSRDARNPRVNKPVTRYRKAHSASESVHAFDLIKETYKNAIEYRTIPAQLRGVILLFGFLTGVLAVGIGWKFFSSILSEDGEIAIFDYLLLSVIVLVVLCGQVIFLLTIRLELFRPIDEPIIFDRKNRKVYCVTRAVAPGWIGIFKPWPIRAHEYDWDLLGAEYQMTISTTGSTMTTWHTLLFIVRNSNSDDRAIGSFHVANPMLLSESTVGPFWEHIRRFMEEDGPHLPPGESKTYLEVPSTLWQSMGVIGPFGSNYGHWWKNHLFYTLLFHVLIPLTFPVFLTWGIMNWLSYKTATTNQWPHEVEAAIGPAIL